MITHVKKNAKEMRRFTKPSHIECALQFRNIHFSQTTDCTSHPRKNGAYYERMNMHNEMMEYLKHMEKSFVIFGGRY